MNQCKAAESNAGEKKQLNRSRQVRVQIVYSVLIKAVSVILGLLLVPLLIDTLNPQRYAVWLTLSSIFAWFSFFDLGLGNGLRNKLAEALAVQNYRLAREYVSTTYAFVTTVFMLLLVIFLFVNPFINWNWALHVDKISSGELFVLTTITCSLFLLRFVFQLIGTVYVAAQKPAMNNIVV